MKISREEIAWIRKQTRPEDKKAVSDYLKRRTHPKKNIQKKKKRRIHVVENNLTSDAERYRWILSTRDKLLLNETDSEKEFYEVLSLLDIPFEKQHPFIFNNRIFFADAYFEKTKTIIEIDGGYHLSKKVRKRDANRTYLFNMAGYSVVRIKNEDVYDREYFLSKLYKHFPVKVDAYKFL